MRAFLRQLRPETARRRAINSWHRVRPLLSGMAVVFVSNGLLKISNAILFIAVVHALGQENAGYYSTATTLAVIALNVGLFGLDEILIREAVHRESFNKVYANFLFARIVLTALSIIALDALLLATQVYPPQLTFIIILLTVGQVGEGVLMLSQALNVAFLRTDLVWWVAAAISGLRVAIGLGLIRLGSGLVDLILMLVATGLIGGLFAVWLGLREVLHLRPIVLMRLIDLPYLWGWLRRSGSFVAISLLAIVEFQIDVVLLSILRAPADVALYSSAQLIMIAAWILPQAYRAVIYPRLAHALAQSPAMFWKFFGTSFKLALALGGSVAIGLAWAAGFVIGFLYPADYQTSVLVLQLLALPLFFAFLSAVSSRALLTLHKERVAALMLGLSVIANVGFNLLLIPPLGSVGAAIARVISGGLFCVVTFVYLWWYRQRQHV
jgi:O-antigen/teichoic acid export membrane protein